MRLFLIILSVTITTSLARAQAIEPEMHRDSSTGATIERVETPPKYLYSWIRSEHLKNVIEESESSRYGFDNAKPERKRQGADLLNLMRPETHFAMSWPQYLHHPSLFTWTNPVTAMLGGTKTELYGDVLARIEIDQEKVIARKFNPGSDFNRHRQQFQGKLPVTTLALGEREWVILDSSAIKSFTLDPELLRPELQHHLEQLRDPKFQYPSEELHFMDFSEAANPLLPSMGREMNVRNYAIRRLETFLKYGRALVPDDFIGEHARDYRPLSKDDRTRMLNDLKQSERSLELAESINLLRYRLAKSAAFYADKTSLRSGYESAALMGKLLQLRLNLMWLKSTAQRPPATDQKLFDYLSGALAMESSEMSQPTPRQPTEKEILDFARLASSTKVSATALLAPYIRLLGLSSSLRQALVLRNLKVDDLRKFIRDYAHAGLEAETAERPSASEMLLQVTPAMSCRALFD